MSKYRVLGIALMVVLVASLVFLGCDKKSPSQANLNQSPQQENANAGVLTGYFTQMNQNKGKEDLERRYVETQLKLHGGDIARTAEALCLERTNLYRKLKQLGIEKA